jgi:hypothetical protein
MRDEGIYCTCAVIAERFGSKCERCAGVDHIIYKDGHLAADITNQELHDLWRILTRSHPLAVDERKIKAKLVGN